MGLWEKVAERCDITITSTVAEDEVDFWEDEAGERHYIDLNESSFKQVDVPLDSVIQFKSRFLGDYFERLDPGEVESLTYLCSSKEHFLICSGDSIVFRILGLIARSGQGISLEELLSKIGLGRQLEWRNTKDFRIKYTKLGEQDSVTGTGLA
ncbi:hypothetical protein STSP2_00365 [Anaerohalosphaera lusitana]|uniref:Uncharacterized protein n=2 Tax=Anaerohalosphaera lusitana TaxID=1936003 RepID=A0A1U9NH11_9BACT|nr:hypothetical protein STSP2_00365 [Anaerohalosphaera lusitana]